MFSWIQRKEGMQGCSARTRAMPAAPSAHTAVGGVVARGRDRGVASSCPAPRAGAARGAANGSAARQLTRGAFPGARRRRLRAGGTAHRRCSRCPGGGRQAPRDRSICPFIHPSINPSVRPSVHRSPHPGAVGPRRQQRMCSPAGQPRQRPAGGECVRRARGRERRLRERRGCKGSAPGCGDARCDAAMCGAARGESKVCGGGRAPGAPRGSPRGLRGFGGSAPRRDRPGAAAASHLRGCGVSAAASLPASSSSLSGAPLFPGPVCGKSGILGGTRRCRGPAAGAGPAVRQRCPRPAFACEWERIPADVLPHPFTRRNARRQGAFSVTMALQKAA